MEKKLREEDGKAEAQERLNDLLEVTQLVVGPLGPSAPKFLLLLEGDPRVG